MEFEQIYRAYCKAVFLYALQLSGDEQIAEEITSETFYKAIRSVDRFRGDCEIRVWLCQIAKNTYYSYLKKHKQELSADEADLQTVADPRVSLEEQLGNRESAQQIRSILHEMQEPYREVFMWRVFGELSFKEIGVLYQKTDNWACVTYHRARKMIQKRLEELEHGT
jgi:RNA polymerase sigma-70 factor (ECF subfamily)